MPLEQIDLYLKCDEEGSFIFGFNYPIYFAQTIPTYMCAQSKLQISILCRLRK